MQYVLIVMFMRVEIYIVLMINQSPKVEEIVCVCVCVYVCVCNTKHQYCPRSEVQIIFIACYLFY
jgi:hypothetical protein